METNKSARLVPWKLVFHQVRQTAKASQPMFCQMVASAGKKNTAARWGRDGVCFRQSFPPCGGDTSTDLLCVVAVVVVIVDLNHKNILTKQHIVGSFQRQRSQRGEAGVGVDPNPGLAVIFCIASGMTFVFSEPRYSTLLKLL